MGDLANLRVVDPVLSSLLLGYNNAELTAKHLFPFVQVPKEMVKIPKWGKDHFRKHDTLRAIRAQSNVGNVGLDTPIVLTAEEHDFVAQRDLRELQEAHDALKLEKHSIFSAQAIVQLTHEYDASVMAQDDANYPEGLKITLVGTAKWSDYTDSDPFAVVQTGKSKIASKIGKEPNTMKIGRATYDILTEHPKVIEKLKYSQTGIVDEEMLAKLFKVKKLIVGRSTYVDDDDVFNDMWADNCILAWVPDVDEDVDVFLPSFGYSPRRKGYPQADTYFTVGGKVKNFRSTDNFSSHIVGAEAGYIIKDCV